MLTQMHYRTHRVVCSDLDVDNLPGTDLFLSHEANKPFERESSAQVENSKRPALFFEPNGPQSSCSTRQAAGERLGCSERNSASRSCLVVMFSVVLQFF